MSPQFAKIRAGLTTVSAIAGLALTSVTAWAGASVTGPLVHQNLAVYLVHDPAATAVAPLDLGTATREGLVKFHKSEGGQTVLIDNLSDKAVFAQTGTFLVGGLQDQIVGRSIVLAPRTSANLMTIYCVERGRSEARGLGRDSYSTIPALLPASVAQLAILEGPASLLAVVKRLRQIGVWASTEGLRRKLSERMGVPIRSTSSPTSLPLALQNEDLERAEQRYLDDLYSEAAGRGDVVGAIFAVNGRLVNAEVYSSTALFRVMWPQVLRAAAIKAIAERTEGAPVAPAVERAIEFVSARPASEAQSAQVASSSTPQVMRLDDGTWVARSRPASEAPRTRDVDSSEHRALQRGGGNSVYRGYLDGDDLLAEGSRIERTLVTMLRSTDNPLFPEVTWAVAGIRANDHEIQLLSSVAQDVEHNLLNSIRRSIDNDERGRALLGKLLDDTSESYARSSPLELLEASATALRLGPSIVGVLLMALAMASLRVVFLKLMTRARTWRAALLTRSRHPPTGARALLTTKAALSLPSSDW